MRFGKFDPTRYDISGLHCLSVDVRAVMGGPREDRTTVISPGVFSLSVHGVPDSDTGCYVGEIVCCLNGREVRIVGALTGRPGVVEVTPDHVTHAIGDSAYSTKLAEWLGIASAA